MAERRYLVRTRRLKPQVQGIVRVVSNSYRGHWVARIRLDSALESTAATTAGMRPRFRAGASTERLFAADTEAFAFAKADAWVRQHYEVIG